MRARHSRCERGEEAAMGQFEAYDLGMLYWFTRWRAPWLDESLLVVTHLGDLAVLIGVALSGAVLLMALRRPNLAQVLLLVTLLGWGIEWGVKLTVARPRPHLAAALAEPPAQPSFPSGHALGTMAVYGSLGLLLPGAFRRRAWPFVTVRGLLSLA